MKKYFFPKTGHDSEAFPETFSNIWKNFPENPLSHSPKVCLYGLKHHFFIDSNITAPLLKIPKRKKNTQFSFRGLYFIEAQITAPNSNLKIYINYIIWKSKKPRIPQPPTF